MCVGQHVARGLALSLVLSTQALGLVFFEEAADTCSPGLVLLQQRAQALRRPVEPVERLPEVADMLSKPSEVLDALSSRAAELEKDLLNMQNESASSINTRKAEYDQALVEQVSNQKLIVAVNANISAEVQRLSSMNQALREQAAEIQRTNDVFRADLAAFQSNVTSMHNLIAGSLAKANDSQAADLQILTDMARWDAAAAAAAVAASTAAAASAQNETRAENEGQPAASSSVSALQLGRTSPEDLITVLEQGLVELRRQESSTLASLKETFYRQYEAGKERSAALFNEQRRLNNSIEEKTFQQQQLHSAMRRLESTQLYLKEQSAAVRAFAEGLGKRPLPGQSEEVEQASLLQLPSNESDESDSSEAAGLPVVTEVMDKQSSVFEALSTQVVALEAQLAAVQRDNDIATANQQEGYRQKLEEQEQENLELESANAAVATEIEQLKESNADLRSRAEELQEENLKLQEDLETMQANMTTAHEFLEGSLSRFNDSEAVELAVLSELDEKDAVQGGIEAKKRSLEEIASSKLAMLEMSAMLSEAPELPKLNANDENPRALVERMSEGLEQLAVAQKEREASLKAAFDKEFEKGAEHRDQLEKQRTQLNATKLSLTDLESRLTVAVQFLEDTRDQLSDRADSLRGFLQRLGEPASDTVSPSEAASDKGAARSSSWLSWLR